MSSFDTHCCAVPSSFYLQSLLTTHSAWNGAAVRHNGVNMVASNGYLHFVKNGYMRVKYLIQYKTT